MFSVSVLPECRFYRFVYKADDPLPHAVFQYTVDVSKPAPKTPLPTPIEPSKLFRPKFFECKSAGSGQTHYALLLLPPEPVPAGKRYPLVHHVYAGPCVQVVKDNWAA